MKVAFIVRSTIFSEKGGDTIQVLKTAKYLEQLGINVEIRLASEKVVYSDYDLLHFFNLGRPADILPHIEQTDTPFVVSSIFVDYEEFDRKHRKGISGAILQIAPKGTNELIKLLGRKIISGEKTGSTQYLWLGQKRSMQKIINRAAAILPNSFSELKRLQSQFQINPDSPVIFNGIDEEIFEKQPPTPRDPTIVLCVARIEGIKNQLNLIKALDNTEYKLYLIGAPAKHQKKYYSACKKTAGSNVHFINHIENQEDLLPYYRKAKVHVLPSWFETTGLSSLEAAAMGCNVVISHRGDAKEYFKEHAFYCDPGSPQSIFEAISKASFSPFNPLLQETIHQRYTWKQTAIKTLSVYQNVLNYANSDSGNQGHTEPVRWV